MNVCQTVIERCKLKIALWSSSLFLYALQAVIHSGEVFFFLLLFAFRGQERVVPIDFTHG